MRKRAKLSRPLLLTILVPLIFGLSLFALVLTSFDAAQSVASEVNQRDLRELAELTSGAIDRLWIQPRNHTVEALSESDVLHRRIQGNAEFETLKQEWTVAARMLEGYFYVYYGLEDGSIEHYPEDPLPEGYDPRERPWYRTGMESESGPVWTEPYEEIITGEIVVSTVVPLRERLPDGSYGDRIGVISTDVTFAALERILEDISLPTGGSILLVDTDNSPFIGSDNEYVEAAQIPESDDTLFVHTSSPMSNGWTVSLVVPRESLAEAFAELRRPIIISSATLFLLAAVIISWLVGRIASRAQRLATYFREAIEEERPLRELFRTRDEFSYLNQQFNRVVSFARDAQEEKLARERTYRFLVEQAPIGFFRSHADGSLLYMNPHCADMFGYTPDQALTEITSVRSLYHDQGARDRFLEGLRTRGEVRHFKTRMINRFGNLIWVSLTARVTSHTETETGFQIEGFLLDITADMEERDTLLTMAETDALTGAANRRAFDAALHEATRHGRAGGDPVGLITFDIDRFKELNDTWGHELGDRILKHVVAVASDITRDDDMCARIGGDEFAVLLRGADQALACRLAERLQEQMRGSVAPPELDTQATISVGVAAYAGTGLHGFELMKAADGAMYRAKRGGGDQIACPDESDFRNRDSTPADRTPPSSAS